MHKVLFLRTECSVVVKSAIPCSVIKNSDHILVSVPIQKVSAFSGTKHGMVVVRSRATISLSSIFTLFGAHPQFPPNAGSKKQTHMAMNLTRSRIGIKSIAENWRGRA